MGVERDDPAVADHREDPVLTALRRIASVVDGPPSTVLEAARAAFLTRDLDAEIAALTADSRSADETAYEPARAEDPAQGQWLLSFQGGGLHIDLEIDDERDGIRLLGQLSGPPVSECILYAERGPARVDLDGVGRFIVDGLTHGPVRLRCELADGRRITTTWVRI
jgi:hypothetical protein